VLEFSYSFVDYPNKNNPMEKQSDYSLEKKLADYQYGAHLFRLAIENLKLLVDAQAKKHDSRVASGTKSRQDGHPKLRRSKQLDR